jgi:glycosyltransferase involved in cell wall biosynthesis
MPLSVIIHTKNAAKTLAQAISSVKFADEIIVIDMESQDETPAIAKKHGVKLITHPDVGYADPARNFGLEQANHDWILVLDADEEIPSELKSLISKIITGQVETGLHAQAFYIARKNILFNKWIEDTGWWPDYQLRLFKKGSVKWQDGVHRLPDASVETIELPAHESTAIIHHNYQSIDQFIDRLNRYTSIKATELTSKNNGSKSLSSSEVVKTFGDEFLSRLFAHHGLKDGLHGLSLSYLQAMYELVVKLKVWQTSEFAPQKSEPETVEALEKFNQNLRYWLADWHIQNSSGLERLWWQIRRKFAW